MLTRRLSHLNVALFAASVVLCMALAVPSSADAGRPLQVTRGLDYLHAHQSSDGRFQDAACTPWAILAIAASGEDPDGRAWTVSGHSPIDYLQGLNLDSYATQGAMGNAPCYYAKMILAYVAAGRRGSIASAGTGRINLVTRLLSYQRSDGRFSPSASAPSIAAVNTTTWAIIALKAAQSSADARSNAVSWLKGQQLADGGFTSTAKGSSATLVSDVDDTAAAVQALIAGGIAVGANVVRDARAYLQDAQRSDGGFSAAKNGSYTYAESTAWGVQAILALGENPESSAWTKGGRSPRDVLRRLQTANGAFRHKKGVVATPMLTTPEAILALAGKSFATFPRGGSSWRSPFVASPKVTKLTPANGAQVRSTTVIVNAAYRDGAGGTGIAPSGVRLTVDGRDMTKQARVSGSSLSIKLTGGTAGEHTIQVRVRDRAGNARSLKHTVRLGSTSGSEGASTSADSPTSGGKADAGGDAASSEGTGTPGGASTTPGVPFPSASATAGSESSPDSADVTGTTAGGARSPNSISRDRAESGRAALLLFGLAAIPAAIGFGLAARSHRRSRRAIGEWPDHGKKHTGSA